MLQAQMKALEIIETALQIALINNSRKLTIMCALCNSGMVGYNIQAAVDTQRHLIV